MARKMSEHSHVLLIGLFQWLVVKITSKVFLLLIGRPFQQAPMPRFQQVRPGRRMQVHSNTLFSQPWHGRICSLFLPRVLCARVVNTDSACLQLPTTEKDPAFLFFDQSHHAFIAGDGVPTHVLSNLPPGF